MLSLRVLLRLSVKVWMQAFPSYVTSTIVWGSFRVEPLAIPTSEDVPETVLVGSIRLPLGVTLLGIFCLLLRM